MQIPFNKPFLGKNAIPFIKKAIANQHISGNGEFTAKCHTHFNQYFFSKTLLTNSCTAALEMAAMLTNIEPGDEVIIPSFTFVSTANAFILRGAKIVFADTDCDYPNLNISSLDELISKKTKAIVPVHYAGAACNMGALYEIASQYNITIIEDAAHALASTFKGKPLGSFGRFGALSFHETKNITSGEGGLLIINDKKDFEQAEYFWEKGTNRTAFYRGEINMYEWISQGSSFLPSDINAAVLYSQIELIEEIQKKRVEIWYKYFHELQTLQHQGKVLLPQVPDYAEVNGHLFFLECESKEARDQLILYLKNKGIHAIFHYLPLHLSPFFKAQYKGPELKNSVKFSERIIRLPLFFDLTEQEQNYIINTIKDFY